MSLNRGAAALAMLAVVTSAGAFSMPPITASGNVKASYSDSQRPNSPNGDNTQRTLSGGVNLGSYLWRPWYALWDASLVVAEQQSHSPALSQANTLWQGGVNLALFPQSRFPIRAYINTSDSRLSSDSGEQGESDSAQNSRTYGLNGNYLDPQTGIAWSGGASRAEQTDSDGNLSFSNQANVGSRLTYQRHHIAAIGDYSETGGELAARDRQLNMLVNDSYRTSNQVDMDSRFQYLRRVVGTADKRRDSEELYLDLNSRWQAPSQKYRLSSHLNGEFAERESQTDTVNDKRYTAGAALTNIWSPQLNSQLSLNVESHETSAGEDGYSSSQQFSLAYNGLPIQLPGWEYEYGLNGQAGSQFSSDAETSYALSAGGTHGVNKVVRYGGDSNTVYRINQSVNSSMQFPGRESFTTLNNLLGITQVLMFARAERLDLRGQLLDSWLWGDEASNFRTLSLSANYQKNLDRYTQLGSQLRYDAFAGKDSRYANAAIEAVLTRNRLLGINSLVYNGELRYTVSDLQDENDEQLNETEILNSINYTIGKILVEMKLDFLRSDDASPFNRYFYISVARIF